MYEKQQKETQNRKPTHININLNMRNKQEHDDRNYFGVQLNKFYGD